MFEVLRGDSGAILTFEQAAKMLIDDGGSEEIATFRLDKKNPGKYDKEFKPGIRPKRRIRDTLLDPCYESIMIIPDEAVGGVGKKYFVILIDVEKTDFDDV